MKCDLLFDIGNHRTNYVGKFSDKIALEICKSYEYLDVSNVHKSLPILNSFNFLKVHTNTFGRNDQS